MFTHLHVHSQYSILDASASAKQIAQCAKDNGMASVALTDHGNLYGAIDFYKACRSSGVKPIIGCEFYVAPGSCREKSKVPGRSVADHLTLLAKNLQGYRNLCKLSSIGFLEGFYYFPRVDRELLKEYSEGLICLSGCSKGPLADPILQKDHDRLMEELDFLRNTFGEDLYLELMRHPMSDEQIQVDGLLKETWLKQQYDEYIDKQKRVNEALLGLSKEYSIPYVATNDCHYLEHDDWRAHEILLNVQSGEPCEIWERDNTGKPKFRRPNPKRRTYPTHELYFKSSEEMEQLFSDLPEAISRSGEIADACNVEFDFDLKHYPVYTPPEMEGKNPAPEEQKECVAQFLWNLCEEGIGKRYTPERLAKVQEHCPDKDPLQVIRERLEYEMSIIVPKGMCDYLLIVWDFIHWAKEQGIPVGPGRGSGAGSIVLYLIGITDIEPLRFNLFFERFINPERLSYPDIDVDICMERRGEVIHYTLMKYGHENVAQIITFGTMKAKMSIKDVGRVLSVPLAKVNSIAKLVPDDLNITLELALEKDADFRAMYNSDEEAKRVIDLAQQLEGSIRNTGIHAAGLVVCAEPLTDYIPICNAKDSELPATQFSMKPVEQVGMLKIDFLGLKTLTCIMKCVEMIRISTDKKIDWINLPLDDVPTYELLNQGKTSGIFQLESAGMQDLARQLHLDRFEEIIAVTSLYRPGPMDMIPSFISRKHGREPIEYDHPWMKEILSETYGIMVYQEQVMQIASKLANYSLGEGDVLRRAMGKKDHEQMQTQRVKFRDGALANNIDEGTATQIFDKMEKFASYGFNKSHAAAYSYVSYVTAFLKANYPKEWMAALMTCDRDDITKVGKLISEARSMGIEMLPPDVNESTLTFTPTKDGIRFALSAIKGVGTGVVEAIVKERNAKGPFKSLYHFIQRISTKRVGKKVIESLAEAGCFDFTGWSRDALKLSVDQMYKVSQKDQKERAAGVMTLFSLMEETEEGEFEKEPAVPNPSTELERTFKEKTLLGFFLSSHPLETYSSLLKKLSVVPLNQIIKNKEAGIFRTAFLIEDLTTRFSSRSQKKFAILSVSDANENTELPIWPELYDEVSPLLVENQLTYAIVQLEEKEGDWRFSCHWLAPLLEVDEAVVQKCDTAFDKAKKKFERSKNWAPKKKRTEMKEKQKPKKATLQVDANQITMKGILTLKTLLEKHTGDTPLSIDFFAANKNIAAIHFEAENGVSLDPFKKEAKEQGFVLAVHDG